MRITLYPTVISKYIRIRLEYTTSCVFRVGHHHLHRNTLDTLHNTCIATGRHDTHWYKPDTLHNTCHVRVSRPSASVPAASPRSRGLKSHDTRVSTCICVCIRGRHRDTCITLYLKRITLYLHVNQNKIHVSNSEWCIDVYVQCIRVY